MRPVVTNSLLLSGLLVLSGTTSAQSGPPPAIQPGNWDVTSTAVDLVIPGAPGFLLRMMRGKSKTEHKCVSPDQARTGMAALFVPKPEAKCTVEQARIADGHVDHVMMCPQKNGAPIRIARTGSYTQAGFAARMTMTGQSDKGAMRVVADQVAARTGGACRK